MRKVISALRAAVERGERAVLCAVVAAEGSAPRHAGAKMAVFADGAATGTIGGGAVELEAIALSRALINTGGAEVRSCSSLALAGIGDGREHVLPPLFTVCRWLPTSNF